MHAHQTHQILKYQNFRVQLNKKIFIFVAVAVVFVINFGCALDFNKHIVVIEKKKIQRCYKKWIKSEYFFNCFFFLVVVAVDMSDLYRIRKKEPKR